MEEKLLKTRTTFITVLCILTFIGSSWSIVSSVRDYLGADTASQSKAMIEKSMDDAIDKIDENDEMSDSQKSFFENMLGSVSESYTPEKIRSSALVSILSALLTLAGAIFMFKLNKKGFLVYLSGIAVAIIGLAVIFGGFMGALAAGGTGFIGVVMIILYGVNLKDMN